jgi:hypothetical protein
MPVQAHANLLPPDLERVGESQWPHAVAGSVQGRCDVAKFDVIGREAYPLDHHIGGGIGSVVVPSVWLGFYLVALIHPFIASGN